MLKINKYIFNQILALIATATFISIFIYLWNVESVWHWSSVFLFVLIVTCEHYLLNLVHIGSHYGISKNRKTNDLISHMISWFVGVSFDVFRLTHQLHHASPNNPEKDPDYIISTRGGLWWISARIFYHDYFFFKKGFYKNSRRFFGYFIDRLIQVMLVLLFVLNGKLYIWCLFWASTMLVIGTLYGLFQFYFPHFTTTTVDNWRKIENRTWFQKFSLFCIDLSQDYHSRHHQNILQNCNYFPLWSYFWDRKKKV